MIYTVSTLCCEHTFTVITQHHHHRPRALVLFSGYKQCINDNCNYNQYALRESLNINIKNLVQPKKTPPKQITILHSRASCLPCAHKHLFWMKITILKRSVNSNTYCSYGKHFWRVKKHVKNEDGIVWRCILFVLNGHTVKETSTPRRWQRPSFSLRF